MEELRLHERAVLALAEWKLVKDGLASYKDLGYGIGGGGVVAELKLLEHLVVEADVAAASKERRRRDG